MLTPEKALRATDRARKELSHGHLDSAQRKVSQALDIAPHCALALFIQGMIHGQMGHFDQAAKYLQEAINNDPTLGSAYLGLGMVFVDQGQFKNALTPLDRATALLPTAWIVYLENAAAHLGLGDTKRALEQAALADRFAQSDRHGKSGVSLLRALVQRRLQDLPREKSYLIQAISCDPHGPYALLAKKELERFEPIPANVK